jgi:hypothetical protein
LKSRLFNNSIDKMKSSRKLNFLLPGLLILAVCGIAIVLASCIITRDSPAPGCIKRIGLPMAGGCFGKTAILDLQVTPKIDSLIFQVNNCNGGVLEVRNTSNQLLVLGGVEIVASDYVSLDVQERQSNGFYRLKETSSNFSQYIPVQDEVIKVDGLLGQEQITVTYTKTKKLCE